MSNRDAQHRAQLKQRNRGRLHDWLNADYPNRIQGRIDPDAVLESRKLEGNVLLKAQALDRIDRHYELKQSVEEATSHLEREAKTDARLLRLFFQDLPRDMHMIYSSAARHVLLAENTAGGMVELERLRVISNRAREEGAPMVATEQIVKLCQDVIEWALDTLAQENFYLEVTPDMTSASKRQAHAQDRRYTRNDTYRALYDKARAVEEAEGCSEAEADRIVAKAEDKSPRTMRRARAYVESGEECATSEGRY